LNSREEEKTAEYSTPVLETEGGGENVGPVRDSRNPDGGRGGKRAVWNLRRATRNERHVSHKGGRRRLGGEKRKLRNPQTRLRYRGGQGGT